MARLTALGRLVSSLFEQTDREVIMSRVSEVFEDISKNVIPMLNIPDTTGKDAEIFRSIENGLKFQKLEMDGPRTTPIKVIRRIFKQYADSAGEYRELFEASFKTDALKDALTYDQVQLLHLLKGVDFASGYARRLALVLANEETGVGTRPLDKEYKEYVMNSSNLRSFCIIMKAMSHDVKDIVKALKEIKDLSYSVKDERLVEKMRGKAVDPLSTNMIPGIGNIAVFFGELHNAWVKKRYDAAQDEKRKLEYTILLLERQKEGASEEELEKIRKQIEYYTKRVNKLNAYIESVEESVE